MNEVETQKKVNIGYMLITAGLLTMLIGQVFFYEQIFITALVFILVVAGNFLLYKYETSKSENKMKLLLNIILILLVIVQAVRILS